jgi:hypothetical protein
MIGGGVIKYNWAIWKPREHILYNEHTKIYKIQRGTNTWRIR